MQTPSFKSILNYARTHRWPGAVVIWCVAAIAFTIWLWSPTLIDVDAFYHLKMARLMMKEHGAIINFPWLQFTTLTQSYVDHHFLYHLILIPFIGLAGDLIGMKIATAALAASAVTAFYVVLRQLDVRLASVWTLLLLFNTSYAFRIGLSKATGLASLLLLVGLWLIITQRWRGLVMWGFIYVWAYGGWPLLLVLSGVAALLRVGSLIMLATREHRRITWRELVQAKLPVLAAGAGTLAGLLIHPSFPNQLQFYWQQIVEIGFVNYSKIIEVGGEWYPTAVVDLLADQLPITALVAISLVCAVITWRRQTTTTWLTGIMALLFIVFTIKSRRYIEYAVPWSLLFAVCSLQASGWWERLLGSLEAGLHRTGDLFYRLIYGLAIAYISVALIVLCTINGMKTFESLRDGTPFNQFAAAGKWLKAHSSRGDIVFHDNWDIFPMLFYQTSKPHYIVGLDPTFMYRFDERLYWAWRDITIGKQQHNLFETLRDDFRARFVLVTHSHTALYGAIVTDGRFKQVYRDDEVTIFRLPRGAVVQK